MSKRHAKPVPPETSKPTSVRRLLFTRQQTSEVLSCSIPTVIRLENAGRLDKVRLDPNKPTSEVRHRVEQVEALARGETEEAG